MTDDFQVVDTSITTELMDSMVEEMAQLKADYDALKKQSTAAHEKYQESRARCIAVLQQAGKSKYFVDGVGTISITEKLKVRTPSSTEEKKELFNWIEQKFGEEGFFGFLGINYNTLNSLYNTEFENAKLEGTSDTFEIPGLSQPEHEYGLSFRK